MPGKIGVRPQTGVNLTMLFLIPVEDLRVCQEVGRYNGILLVTRIREGLGIPPPSTPPTLRESRR